MTPDISWIAGLIIFGIGAVASAVFAVVCGRKWSAAAEAEKVNRYSADPFGWALSFAGSLLGLLVSVGALIALLIPLDMDYHQYKPVHGRVTEVGKRLIAEDKSMSERYVLVIGGQPYGVDDTRASLVKVGDTVTLSCKRDWQWAAESGWVCNWGVQ